LDAAQDAILTPEEIEAVLCTALARARHHRRAVATVAFAVLGSGLAACGYFIYSEGYFIYSELGRGAAARSAGALDDAGTAAFQQSAALVVRTHGVRFVATIAAVVLVGASAPTPVERVRVRVMCIGLLLNCCGGVVLFTRPLLRVMRHEPDAVVQQLTDADAAFAAATTLGGFGRPVEHWRRWVLLVYLVRVCNSAAVLPVCAAHFVASLRAEHIAQRGEANALISAALRAGGCWVAVVSLFNVIWLGMEADAHVRRPLWYPPTAGVLHALSLAFGLALCSAGARERIEGALLAERARPRLRPD
jgi:hypothetical protein